MKIAYVIRADGQVKPGGDTGKVHRFVKALSALGHETRIVYGEKEIESIDADLVHLLNLDLPLENLYYAKRLRLSGIPVVLSTIRHPLDGMKSMYRNGDDFFYNSARRVGIEDDTAFGIRERMKLVAKNHPAMYLSGMKFSNLQQQLVESVSHLLPMAPSESEILTNDFKINKNKITLVPNGFTFEKNNKSERKLSHSYKLVSVGRIEPRKNTLRIARLADRLGLTMLIVGSVNHKHQRYANEFYDLISTSKYISYAGNLSPDRVRSALQSAEIYVNAAWFEVVSQADSEAASVGTKVLTTRYSYGRDFLNGSGGALDPNLLIGRHGADYFESQLSEASVPAIESKTTWDDAVSSLLVAYKKVAG